MIGIGHVSWCITRLHSIICILPVPSMTRTRWLENRQFSVAEIMSPFLVYIQKRESSPELLCTRCTEWIIIAGYCRILQVWVKKNACQTTPNFIEFLRVVWASLFLHIVCWIHGTSSHGLRSWMISRRPHCVSLGSHRAGDRNHWHVPDRSGTSGTSCKRATGSRSGRSLYWVSSLLPYRLV